MCVKKYFKEYRLEFTVGVIAILGLLLIGLRGQVETMLRQGYLQLVSSWQAINQWLKVDLPRFLLDQPLSTLIGWLLVLLAIPLVIYRLRYRFSVSEHWKATDCPKCGGELLRVHRNLFDRLLSRLFLPTARRYHCANPDCSWSGLRRSRRADQFPIPLQGTTRLR